MNSSVAPGGCWMIGQLPSVNDSSCTLLDPLYSYEGYLREITLWNRLLPAVAVCAHSAAFLRCISFTGAQGVPKC